MDDLKYLQKSFSDAESSDGRLPLFIIEDDILLANTLKKYFNKKNNFNVQTFNSPQRFLDYLENFPSTYRFCVVTDVSFDGSSDGISLIDRLNEEFEVFSSIVMTGFGSIESAINATKKGVFHYLTKPFELDDLFNLVVRSVVKKLGVPESRFKSQEPAKPVETATGCLKKIRIEKPAENEIFEGMVGRSKKMKSVFERIEKVAKCTSTVLITGPSGTGKELVANAIHSLSSRMSGPKISVNCGAIPADLLESELFGHRKGSFTGAISDRKGRFELSNKGTIFLDEIGDMPLLLQVKLLRVLQTKTIEPVGAQETIKIDSRVIAATHQNLDEKVDEKSFREDLFYRLNVIPIKIPALKDRKEDIPILIGHFLSKFVSGDGRNNIEFSPEALDLVMAYDWPGNIRELENLVERLVILRGGKTIGPEDLPPKLYRGNPMAVNYHRSVYELPETGLDLKRILTEIEDSLILQALNRTNGNKNQASKLLYLNRTTLIEKMKKRKIIFDNAQA